MVSCPKHGCKVMGTCSWHRYDIFIAKEFLLNIKYEPTFGSFGLEEEDRGVD